MAPSKDEIAPAAAIKHDGDDAGTYASPSLSQPVNKRWQWTELNSHRIYKENS